MLTSREKLSAAYPSRSLWALKTKEKQGHLSSAARLTAANRRSTKCQRTCPAALVSALSRQSCREIQERKRGTVTGRCVCVCGLGGGGEIVEEWGAGGNECNRCGYFIIN